MVKYRNIGDARYYIKGKKRPQLETTKEVYYTAKLLQKISNSWESVYKKLQTPVYCDEKKVFDLYKSTGVKWEDLHIIACLRT